MPPLNSGENVSQLFEAGEIVPGEEAVDVRQRRRIPARELVVRMPLQRIDPDDCVGLPRQPRHLVPDDSRILAFPAVGDDDDDGAARGAASPNRR